MPDKKKRPLHIFIIDDDVEDQELLMEAFTEIDRTIQFSTAGNGRDGINKLIDGSVQKPDLILVDMNMPMINGKQFLAELKKYPLLSGFRVIVCSTSSNDSDIEETLARGAVQYFQKPSNYATLKKELTSILQGIK